MGARRCANLFHITSIWIPPCSCDLTAVGCIRSFGARQPLSDGAELCAPAPSTSSYDCPCCTIVDTAHPDFFDGRTLPGEWRQSAGQSADYIPGTAVLLHSPLPFARERVPAKINTVGVRPCRVSLSCHR